MTIDEAIKHCEEVVNRMTAQGDCKECAADHRQLAEWLKELKQLREQQTCDDCISRQAVLEAFSNLNIELRPSTINIITAMIKIIPSVAPQSKIGHWIGHRDHCESLGRIPSGLGAYNWCSNCDCPIDVEEYHRIHYNFCPNCGTKMKVKG